MNRKIIGKVMAFLLLLEALFLIPPAAISFFDGARDALFGIVVTMAIAIVLGLLL